MKLLRMRASFLPGTLTIFYHCLALPLSIVLAIGLCFVLAWSFGFVSDHLSNVSGSDDFGILSTLLDVVGMTVVYVLPILLVVAVWKFGRKVRTLEQKRGQRFRDEVAASISDSEWGKTPDSVPDRYVLHLRPFVSTGAVRVLVKRKTSSYTPPGSSKCMSSETTNVWEDMETVIAQAIERIAAFVALGRPGEHVGARRIESEDSNWRDEFARLANGAERILAVPSRHSVLPQLEMEKAFVR